MNKRLTSQKAVDHLDRDEEGGVPGEWEIVEEVSKIEDNVERDADYNEEF